MTVASPRTNARYSYGETVHANYSCLQPAYALGITSCAATDDLGNTINAGGRLVTNVPGPHQLTVIGTSVDGLASVSTVNYTVLPNNVFKITKGTLASGGLSAQLVVPGAGKIAAIALSGGATVAKTTITAHSGGHLRLRLSVGSHRSVRLRVTYTPKGGVSRTLEAEVS